MRKPPITPPFAKDKAAHFVGLAVRAEAIGDHPAARRFRAAAQTHLDALAMLALADDDVDDAA